MISRRFILSLFISLIAFPAIADDLAVISYNVQFLPGIAAGMNKRKEPEYRAQRIGEEMAAYDIVALQETFNDTHRPLILDALKAKWEGEVNLVRSPTPEGFMTSGGCLIATRRPIVEENSVVFTVFSKPEDYGVRADGHAAKGVIHARIARNAEALDDCIDVFVTHLEARADELRPEQYKQMAAFIAKHSDASRPMVLMGDMNTRGMAAERDDPESQYTQLMAALAAVRADIVDMWIEVKPDALGGTSEQESADVGKRIDYIFYGPGESAALTPVDIEVKLYQDERVEALSDHNAVAAVFDWKAP